MNIQSFSGIFSASVRVRRNLAGGLLASLALLLSACGGGGSSSGVSTESGEVVVALTDAEGDFVSYSVDVVSVQLTRADGRVVETLPLSTRVDFARYTELTEFLTAATVPAGRYVAGSITLDFTAADIWAEDASGNARRITQILDSNGDPLGRLEVSVSLDGHNALPVAPGIPRNLTLDFDLEQSNRVVFDTDDVVLTVAPFIIAEVDPQRPRVHRLRGPLQSVNPEANRFRIHIRPFYHRVRFGERVFGSLTVLTDETTFYEIDGLTYQGPDGLDVLADSPALTAVIVRGDLRFSPLRFEAREVYAGSSVPGGDMDVVQGTVVARTPDDRLTVMGATLFRSDGAILFNDRVEVQLDASTTVSRQLSTGSFSIDDISVGQRLSVFGLVTNDSVSELEFSAANGYARMHLSSLRGDVAQLADTESFLALQLMSINGRSIELYDFSGTGTDSADDADGEFYEVDTGPLALDSLAVSERVQVRGFASPFGSAPADFSAQTIVAEN